MQRRLPTLVAADHQCEGLLEALGQAAVLRPRADAAADAVAAARAFQQPVVHVGLRERDAASLLVDEVARDVCDGGGLIDKAHLDVVVHYDLAGPHRHRGRVERFRHNAIPLAPLAAKAVALDGVGRHRQHGQEHADRRAHHPLGPLRGSESPPPGWCACGAARFPALCPLLWPAVLRSPPGGERFPHLSPSVIDLQPSLLEWTGLAWSFATR